ncbi:hypothetical protein [Paenibacillus sp. Leaf72]|uniref:hypothetical protein n=1 Tax=Paenibacillus sp. Leaf72 TaxID=1736234 RepID=UPI0006F91965|nr:hypothetical protein [Paenibacillus sp. Leaf72]KQO10933.1 hypothetical protein ASF12_11200 [Paenibacillus sp. Leaf72]
MKKNTLIRLVAAVIVVVIAAALYMASQYTTFQKAVLDSVGEADITAIELVRSSATTAEREEKRITNPQEIDKIMAVFAKMKF